MKRETVDKFKGFGDTKNSFKKFQRMKNDQRILSLTIRWSFLNPLENIKR
jgi:hypothetical protein